jgi:hypothetical protein
MLRGHYVTAIRLEIKLTRLPRARRLPLTGLLDEWIIGLLDYWLRLARKSIHPQIHQSTHPVSCA